MKREKESQKSFCLVFKMKHSLKTILIFTLIHACLNSQENLSESRKIGDLSNRIQLLKSDLLQLKNDSGTPNAENYLQSIRTENQVSRNNPTPLH